MSNKRFVVGAFVLLSACGWSSPENFVETSTRVGCQKMKKCDESEWSAAGFDSVNDCVDKSLDAPLGLDGTNARDAFVAMCDDFDKESARKCLAGARKVKRTCDENAADSDQEAACAKVCGDPQASELFRDPVDIEAALAVVEAAEEADAEE